MQTSIWILALAYLVGLVASAVSWGAYAICCVGAIAVVTSHLIPRRFGTFRPSPWLWLIAVGVALIASFYVQWRAPHPISNDISHWLSQTANQPAQVLVTGTVESVPRVTRSQRGQIWLEASHVSSLADPGFDPGQDVQGRLYVTIPLLQATGVYPGQFVTVEGRLYRPDKGGGRCLFDFQDYLARNHSFAGLSGQRLDLSTARQPAWGSWQLQQKIVRSLTRPLDVPAGPLMSAMVIGNQTVDIPFEVRDWFVRSGLCHALAASGFQVSLILGVILALTARFSSNVQGVVGAIALVCFLSLSGLQPSVVRAVLMGFAVLAGVVSDRKIKPLNALLVVAMLMLIANPVWIWDIGFQLSFLATLGLLVTAPSLVAYMEWLPPLIATMIAVPVAATIWTLPIQIYSFCLVSPYSLLANIITAPLIAVVSLGGFASALLSLVWEALGSLSAWVMYYPTDLLIQIVQWFSALPGSFLGTGTISLLQLFGVYGIWIGVWQVPALQTRWLLGGGLAIALLVIPTVSTQAAKIQLTVLDSPTPAIVVQDQGRVGLFVAGRIQNPEFSILPFLRQQGINRLDGYAGLQKSDQDRLRASIQIPIQQTVISGNNWDATTAPVGQFKPVQVDQQAGYTDLEFRGTHWLLPKAGARPKLPSKAQNMVLIWTGQPLEPQWLKQQALKAAIATGKLDEQTAQILQQQKVPLYLIQEQGVIAWTPAQGITPVQDMETHTSWIP
jgi:competence protein ComEC